MKIKKDTYPDPPDNNFILFLQILADYQNNVLWELLNVTDGVSFASSTASSSSVATGMSPIQ